MTTMRTRALSRRGLIGLICTALLALAPGSPQADPAAAGAPLQIWFIRHAESEINLPEAPRPVPDSGVTYPLTRRGMEQARKLAEALAGVPVTAIYSSTHLRAVQTADAIAFEHGVALKLAPEAVGIELGIDADTAADPRAAYQELARKWLLEKQLDARHGTGESFAEAQRRFLPFVRELMNRHAHDSGVVIVVAHSTTLELMVPVLANNVPPQFALRHPVPLTGIIKTELRDSRLYCTAWLGVVNTDFDRARGH